MKIKITRSKLNEALKRVSSGANAKMDVRILANVKMVAKGGVLALTTSNMYLTLHTEVPCEVVEEGATTMPIRMLGSIVSAMFEGEVQISENGNKARIVCGSFVTQVGTLPADEFPTIKRAESESKFSVSVKTVRDLLRKTAYAQYQSDDRKILNGVLFEFTNNQMRCVATDGRRIAVAEAEGEYSCTDIRRYIIPASTVSNLMKFIAGEGDMEVVASKNQIRFVLDGGSNEIISRLVDGVYPNYKQVIPSNNKNIVEADREDVIGAVERVSVMAVRDDSCVKMTIADNRMLVEVKGDDLCDAHDDIPVKYDGEKVEIIFNPRYVLDCLRASDSDTVKMEFEDGLSPANFRSLTEKYLCTLMPLRVSNI